MRPEERRLVGKMPPDGHVHLPHEAGSSDPLPLEYSELGDGKEFVEGQSFRKAQTRAKTGEFSPADEDPEAAFGEFAPDTEGIGSGDWVLDRPFDSAEWLDGPAPMYFDDPGGGGGVGDDI